MAADGGTRIFRQEAKFIAGAGRIWQLPKLALPEVAFIGKSNVGKSSLINMICRRKSLAKVSNTPGRTRQINFFSIGDKLILVDLPGYGYANVEGKVKFSWEKLITFYLSGRENLRLVNLLIDARRGIKENDIIVMSMLNSWNRKFQIIFTKVDKIKFADQFSKESQNYLSALGYSCSVIYTSSKSGEGAKELQLSLVQSV